ncbi:MAG: UDP-N-acetylmuramoyl-tripeptide--D-alanyl-D-alanine ligase [Ignavibacterium sp.]|jgi:UDP-N-acetylmuramoyl-tripeptide--D-alanyl-D-alanine ligase|nr:UDP-N-acetylmuramoyl-tripeptide--D-alanyl-D-alanine ligase [Ignavibacterium sp.]
MKRTYLNIKDIFNIPTAVIHNPDVFKTIYNVSIDSRTVKKNTLFIAVKGQRFDGHNFINEAVKKGAVAVIVNENNFKNLSEIDIPVITVKDTTKALGDIAKIWRLKLKTKIIGITGSAGKTTTKEILAALLSEKFKVNKTIANNNNHIGVPLTILSTNEKHNILVAELGTNHFGEIPYTASILSPDFALITNIGDSHLEYFKNRKGVLKEKSALFNETIKRNGKVFINNDDKLLKEIGKKIKSKVSFALDEKADYKTKILGYDKSVMPHIVIKNKKKLFDAVLPVIGEKNVLNFTSAFAIASELGLTDLQIKNALKKVKTYRKRLEVKNYRKFTLINDTYNANPDSMRSSFDVLNKIQSRKRRIAVIGDMFELGNESKAKHLDLADLINKTQTDEIYSIGKMMKLMDKKLNGKTKTHQHFTQRESLKNILKKIDITDSAILIKGSRGMKMEEFVSVIEDRKK